MIPVLPEPDFPINERLATEYNEEDEESHNFRLQAMRQLLTQWADCYLATAIALLLSVAYVQERMGLALVLAPLAVLDVKLIVQAGRRWKRNEGPEQYKAQMKELNLLEVFEHSCTLICKLLIATALTFSAVPLVSGALPLAFHLVIRFCYRETSLSDCYAFSGMVSTT